MAKKKRPAFALAAVQSTGLGYLAFVIGSGFFGAAVHDLQVGLGIALGSLVFYGPACVILLCFPLILISYIASSAMLLTLGRILLMGASCGALLGYLGALIFGPGLRRYTSGIPNSIGGAHPHGVRNGARIWAALCLALSCRPTIGSRGQPRFTGPPPEPKR